MDAFPPFNVSGQVSGRISHLPHFTVALDLNAAYDQAERNYVNRDCPMMWPFECVHTLYICGPRAKIAFTRYADSLQHPPIAMNEYGDLRWHEVPITFTNTGEGFMFVEHQPPPYTRG